METLAAGRDLDDPKVKREVAAQVLPLIRDISSPIERETYRQPLARLLKVDERSLWDEAARPPRRSARRATHRAASERSRQPSETSESLVERVGELRDALTTLEGYCLGVLLRRPDLVYRVDRAFQEFSLGRLSPADFESADHQVILQVIVESLGQDQAEPLIYVLNDLSLPLMELADQLLVATEKLDPNEDRVFEDLVRALLDLRRRHLRQHIDHLRYLMEEAQLSGDLRASEYLQAMRQYTDALHHLDRAIGQYTTSVVRMA
jgi:DNA primase